MVDSQLQGVNALATRIVCVGVGVSTRCSVGRIMPCEALTSSLRFHIVRTIVDGEFQGVNTGATVCIVVRKRVRA